MFCFHQKYVSSFFTSPKISNKPLLSGEATWEDIDSVIMVVGGPDGIKKPIMKDLDNILSPP